LFRKYILKNKFQIFTWKFAKIRFSNGIVSEREKNTALRVRKEVNSMELSSSQRETIRHQFDSFCKKVLREEYRDCVREAQRRLQYEVSFSELSPQELDQLYVVDEYPSDSHHFSVLGYDVPVKDDLISAALDALPEQKRDIILLSYFLDMTDQEIGEKLNMVRRTVQYQRTSSLNQLKKLLEGKADE
jgi:RNA polymerase sigma factor (sigma-70 family)